MDIGQNGYPQSHLHQLMMGNVNDVSLSYVAAVEDDPNNHHHHQFVASDYGFENQRLAPFSYYEFLTENNNDNSNSSILDRSPLAPVTDSHFTPGGITTTSTQLQTQFMLYNNYPPGMATKPVDSSTLHVDSWAFNPNPYLFNISNYESSSPNVRCDEKDPLNKLKSLQDQRQAQGRLLWTQDQPTEQVGNVSQLHPRPRVAASVFVSNPGPNESRKRTTSTDRLRKERIAERFKALQELLPHSAEGSQTAVMDEIINYIKYLQLQIKELSGSRLGGHFSSAPPIFLQGNRHYILNEQTLNEPLEETMTKFLKVNSSAATKFLESRGLLVMPIALADFLKEVM